MESQFIAWLRERLSRHPQLMLGPGDDAAVLRLGERSNCVVTTDMLMDGVDFVLESTDPRRIGHKSLAVNLSDLAAMAARPLAAVVSVALPRQGGFDLGRELVEGMLPLAERYRVALAGGDTNSWDGPLVISVTAIGETTDCGPLVRFRLHGPAIVSSSPANSAAVCSAAIWILNLEYARHCYYTDGMTCMPASM